MATNTAFNDYYKQEFEDLKTIKNAAESLKKGFVNYYSTIHEEDITADYEKILKHTALSIKMYSNSHYKNSETLEPMEIEQIKNALNNYANDKEKIKTFKQALIEDLTEFQKQIKSNHIKKITDLTKEKQFFEKQIRVLEFEKNKLIMERLSKIVWPYDQKTKEYETKIAQMQSKVQHYTNKIESLEQMRPMANEKDILLYKMHLKEKFADKK